MGYFRRCWGEQGVSTLKFEKEKHVKCSHFGEQLLRLIPTVSELYNRLILVVAPGGGGKTASLLSVASRTGAQLVDLNLELSRRLLELTERQRKLQASRLVGELVGQAAVRNDASGVVLLDNIEILFDVSLSIDPLRLLEEVARNWTLVVAWRGRVDSGRLVYAHPAHPEFRRYQADDLVIVTSVDEQACQ